MKGALIKMQTSLRLLLTLFFVVGIPATSFSQEFLENVEQETPINEVDDRIQLNNPQVELEQIPSLFLTSSEQNLLIAARLGFLTRPPTSDEFNQEQDRSGEVVSRPSSPREVALGGLLYVSSNDWTIWLNNQKITPKNIPPAIMDIEVSKDHIKMKWLDFQTNQIFPVKLRSHQRFNLDTRIFLPG
jgi:hypothetical protein